VSKSTSSHDRSIKQIDLDFPNSDSLGYAEALGARAPLQYRPCPLGPLDGLNLLLEQHLCSENESHLKAFCSQPFAIPKLSDKETRMCIVLKLKQNHKLQQQPPNIDI
jgi:hypothetical protein